MIKAWQDNATALAKERKALVEGIDEVGVDRHQDSARTGDRLVVAELVIGVERFIWGPFDDQRFRGKGVIKELLKQGGLRGGQEKSQARRGRHG